MARQNNGLAEMIARTKKAVEARKANPQLPPEEVKSEVGRLAGNLLDEVSELSRKHGANLEELFDVVAAEFQGVNIPEPETELLLKLANGKTLSQKVLEHIRWGLSEEADTDAVQDIVFARHYASTEAEEQAGWRLRYPRIKEEHAKRLIECSEKTGRSVESLTDEMAGDFCESFVVAYIWGAEERSLGKSLI